MNKSNNLTSLVIFTCEGREHLLQKTIESFNEHCNYKWTKVILAIDGKINPSIVEEIAPDSCIQQRKRSGYVNSIVTTLKTIKTPYFFWLEDDWKFHSRLNLEELLSQLEVNDNWAEILLSKTGPLTPEEQVNPLNGNFFHSIYGFSANPCLCNTKHLQAAFEALEQAPKGGKLGEDGFENFLSRKFKEENLKTVVMDPVDHQQISHEGYLESTARNWHMTNSIEQVSEKHLLIFPKPSFMRRLLMVIKLLITFVKLAFKQLISNKTYEYCFRVITGYQNIK